MKKIIFVFSLFSFSIILSSQSDQALSPLPDIREGSHCNIMAFMGLTRDNFSKKENCERVHSYSKQFLFLHGGYYIGSERVKIKIRTCPSPSFLSTDFGQKYCQKYIQHSLKKCQDENFFTKDYLIYAVSHGAATLLNSNNSIPNPKAILFESPLFFPNSAISHKMGLSKSFWKKIVPHFASLLFPRYKPSGQQPLDSAFFHNYKNVPIIIIAHKNDRVVPFENSLAMYYAACKERENQNDVYLIVIDENDQSENNHFGLALKSVKSPCLKKDLLRVGNIIYYILKKHSVVYFEKRNLFSNTYENHVADEDKEEYHKLSAAVDSHYFQPPHSHYKMYHDKDLDWHKFDKKYALLFKIIRTFFALSILTCCFYALKQAAC